VYDTEWQPLGPAEVGNTSPLRQLERERKLRLEAEAALAQKTQEHTQSTQLLRQLTASLMEKERKTRALLEAAADGIVSIDDDDRIDSFNPAAEALFGYTAVEVLGHDVNLLLATPYRAQQAEFVAKYLPGNPEKVIGRHGEVVGRHKDGTTFPLELSISEMRLGQRRLFIMILRDITERKRADERLRRMNADLAQARDQALEASQAKSMFLANMSHELRTPLNAIILYSGLLAEEAQDQGLETFLPDLEHIETASKHLLGLINGVLDLSKIEAGKMELFLETVDVAGLVQDVVSTIRPLVQKNANTLTVSCAADLGPVHTDVTKVRQVLFNLVSNACKFTTQGTIGLSAERVATAAGERLRFRVADSGIGMTPEQLAKLFKNFTQPDGSTTRKFGGTGLGLAISRHFCQMLGGDITAASEPGRGSTFTVLLPVRAEAPPPEAPPEPVAAAAPAGAAPAADGHTILVIDDDPQVLDLARRQLSPEGFRVVTAAGGEEGLRLARAARPAAIVMDVLMPGMDGWTVLAALKADAALADIPVIMVSAVNDQEMGYALGAADYLLKPFDRDGLTAALRKYRLGPASRPVLIVEDDPTTRELMARLVRDLGCPVREAGNGRAALECMGESLPQLVLLDLMMPEMDGFQFLEAVCRRADWREVPVIVLSAMDLTQADRERLSGCVRQIVQKGALTREELVQKLRGLLAVGSQDGVSA
jgi:PAS domain S-box-containing protein